MKEDLLVRELDRECIALYEQGKGGPAAAGRRIANSLRTALRAHRVALDEATRMRKSMKAAGVSPEKGTALAIAEATARDRWRVVTAARENVLHFLKTVH